VKYINTYPIFESSKPWEELTKVEFFTEVEESNFVKIDDNILTKLKSVFSDVHGYYFSETDNRMLYF
jgi:hypothetical protein